MYKSFILGARLDSRAARGDVPFYQLPFIELRAGSRRRATRTTNFGDAETVTSWGAGFRYLVARRLGI